MKKTEEKNKPDQIPDPGAGAITPFSNPRPAIKQEKTYPNVRELTVSEYLEYKEKDYLLAIEEIGYTDPDGLTRLKAFTTLLNKIRPDKHRSEITINSDAPYEIFSKLLANQPPEKE